LSGSYLTKSRYVAGLQCPRRLWLLANEPAAHEKPEPGSVLDFGRIIGEKARLLFPGGILVEEAAFQHAQAVARTAALMADPDVPAIFEAAFSLQDIRIRVDILERRPAGWRLLEVKSSTEVKGHHLDDVALQAFVLAGLSVVMESHFLVHVNTAYVRGAGEVDWSAYFTKAKVDEEIAKRLPSLPGRLSSQGQILLQAALPHAEPSKQQCRKPVECGFWDRCTADKPADWVGKLPRLREKQVEALAALGVESIADIPDYFPLPHNQAVVRETVISGAPYIAQDLPRLLHGFGPPAFYLDFEAMMPPIPLYEGTKPYQALPFQWSLHIDDGSGELRHLEFLTDGKSDPRREFAECLIAAVAGNDYPIVVYSGYEEARLKELASEIPDIAADLNAIISRLVDLLPVVRSAIYFPAFYYSYSIKSVAPALVPGFTYDDLDGIAGGGAAAAAFLQLAVGQRPESVEEQRTRKALLAYCQKDTLAIAEVHRALIRNSETNLFIG
jgi:predicted RecB family nuclease